MAVYTVKWTTRRGQVRLIRLYRSWNNLRARVAGKAAGNRTATPWAGLPIGFEGWLHFREWSLSTGYCRARNSLDRIDPLDGYHPTNCQWLSVADNTRKQNEDMARRRRMDVLMPVDDWDGELSYVSGRAPREGVPF